MVTAHERWISVALALAFNRAALQPWFQAVAQQEVIDTHPVPEVRASVTLRVRSRGATPCKRVAVVLRQRQRDVDASCIVDTARSTSSAAAGSATTSASTSRRWRVAFAVAIKEVRLFQQLKEARPLVRGAPWLPSIAVRNTFCTPVVLLAQLP